MQIKIFFPVNARLINVVNKRLRRFVLIYFQGLLHRLCVMLTLSTIPSDVSAEVCQSHISEFD